MLSFLSLTNLLPDISNISRPISHVNSHMTGMPSLTLQLPTEYSRATAAVAGALMRISVLCLYLQPQISAMYVIPK